MPQPVPLSFETAFNMKPDKEGNCRDPKTGTTRLFEHKVSNNLGALKSLYKCSDKSRGVCIGVDTPPFVRVFYYAASKRSGGKIIPDESLLPRPLPYEILQNTFPGKASRQTAAFPQYAPALEAVDPSQKRTSCLHNCSLM